MTKTSKAAEKAALIAKYEALRAAERADSTVEARTAVIAASAELSAWITANDPPKMRGTRSGRAGQRQAAERDAQYGRRR